jgi:hypothetical protein
MRETPEREMRGRELDYPYAILKDVLSRNRVKYRISSSVPFRRIGGSDEIEAKGSGLAARAFTLGVGVDVLLLAGRLPCRS